MGSLEGGCSLSKWKEINTIEEWKEALEASAMRPVVILKHSTACPVSANALDEYDNYLQDHAADAEYLLVKVIESRHVSNQIAEDLALKHESPQIILIKDKQKFWSASHWSVTYAHITAVLN